MAIEDCLANAPLFEALLLHTVIFTFLVVISFESSVATVPRPPTINGLNSVVKVQT